MEGTPSGGFFGFWILLFRCDVVQLPQNIGKADILIAVQNIRKQQERIREGNFAVAVHVAVRGDRNRRAAVADACAAYIAGDLIGLRADNIGGIDKLGRLTVADEVAFAVRDAVLQRIALGICIVGNDRAVHAELRLDTRDLGGADVGAAALLERCVRRGIFKIGRRLHAAWIDVLPGAALHRHGTGRDGPGCRGCRTNGAGMPGTHGA